MPSEQRDAVDLESEDTVDLGIDPAANGRSTGYLGFGAAFVTITALSAALLRFRSG